MIRRKTEKQKQEGILHIVGPDYFTVSLSIFELVTYYWSEQNVKYRAVYNILREFPVSL